MGYFGYYLGLIWYGALTLLKAPMLFLWPPINRVKNQSGEDMPAYVKAEMAMAFGMKIRQ